METNAVLKDGKNVCPECGHDLMFLIRFIDVDYYTNQYRCVKCNERVFFKHFREI